MLIVTRPFVGHGFNMPAPGTLIDPPEDVANYLIGIDVCEPYETKVQTLPDEVKKNEPSESSRQARRPRRKTAKRSKKSAKKSSQ